MGQPVTVEQIAGISTGGVKIPFTVREKLVYLANDSSSYDIKVNFNRTVSEVGAFTIKPGEIVSDVPMDCISISVEGVGGSVAFRALGV